MGEASPRSRDANKPHFSTHSFVPTRVARPLSDAATMMTMLGKYAVTGVIVAATVSASPVRGPLPAEISGRLEDQGVMGDQCHPTIEFDPHKDFLPPCIAEQYFSWDCEKRYNVVGRWPVLTNEAWKDYGNCLFGEGSTYLQDMAGCLACKDVHHHLSPERLAFFREVLDAGIEAFKKAKVPNQTPWWYTQDYIGRTGGWDRHNALPEGDRKPAKNYTIGEYYENRPKKQGNSITIRSKTPCVKRKASTAPAAPTSVPNTATNNPLDVKKLDRESGLITNNATGFVAGGVFAFFHGCSHSMAEVQGGRVAYFHPCMASLIENAKNLLALPCPMSTVDIRGGACTSCPTITLDKVENELSNPAQPLEESDKRIAAKVDETNAEEGKKTGVISPAKAQAILDSEIKARRRAV